MSFLSENLLSILSACIAVLAYIFLRKRLNYFSDRGLAYHGTTWRDVYNTFTVEVFNDIPNKAYERSRGLESSYTGFFNVLMTPSILVLDPDLAESILIKDFSHFQDHGFDVDTENNPLTGHLFNMKGDEWRTLRHKLVPTFTSGKLKGMVPIMEECADKLIQEINENSELKKDTNLKDLYKRYSLSVIASCAFGIDPESIKDPNCQFRKILQQVVSPKWVVRFFFMLMFLFPKILTWLRYKGGSVEIEDFMRALTVETMEMRKKSGVKRNDFIQLLLELKEKGSVDLDLKELEQDEKETMLNINKEPTNTKLELTDDLLTAQVFVFLIGGFENIAYLVSLTQYMLSKYPDVQSKAREEVLRCKEKQGRFDYQALRDMKYLSAVIDEALRLYSPSLSILRVCNKTYTLPDGKKIEEGTQVMLPAKSFHMDSRYWRDPEKFNPDRFLNGDSVKPGTYMPFGDGPRICIAQRMALLVAKLMIAKALMNFELQPSSKTIEPVQLEIKLIANFKGGLYGTFKDLKQ